VAVNWALGLQQGNAGDAFAQSFQQGQVNNRQSMARSAMAALVANPTNQRALQALASVDPQAAQQFQAQHQQQTQALLEQHRDNIVKGAQLIRQMQPKDDASWQQVLNMAHQAGIDTSEVPPHFDPQYVQGVVQLADTFAPQPNGQVVPFVPGGGVARMNPTTHQLETLVMPNEGGHQTGAPAGNIPQVSDQSSYDAVPSGSQYMAPDGHIRVKGGQSPQGSGGFPH
jgi:hypothetical protein